MTDRATRKPSEHTIKAYRQDFTAVTALLTDGRPSDIALTDITKNKMRAAFRRLRLRARTGLDPALLVDVDVLCDFLYTAEVIGANPMPFVGRPKAAKTLPRSLPRARGRRAARGG